LWRDFFRFAALKYGQKWFAKGGIQSNVREYQNNKDYFEAWISGRTGFSFMDANMRELATTGFMSNRGRQNVASFFTQNLNMDWRWGAEYFESMLLDYDPASNYGNWMYNATLGHDPRSRFFNIELQANRYDSSGEYVMLWCRELKKVPLSLRHKPYIHNQSMFVAPIIDLEKSYEEIRKRA
jgi:deoxyribodipyrimidine photo-lyase